MAESSECHSVQVAVNIRPLIDKERSVSCQECVTVVPGEPQVQVYPDKAYTFDHVYGSTGAPQSHLFDDCVLPLVEGLFKGYNATVLAYGQTGSGKTWTMGTSFENKEGVIPKTMKTIFTTVEDMKNTSDFKIRVSFIEIHKENIRDLLDSSPAPPPVGTGNSAKASIPTKPPISIRETQLGGVTLTGVTETSVFSLEDMAETLEQGSQCRATASTNMNSKSSRSHAIFTIILEKRRRWDAAINDSLGTTDVEDCLCAKLHLVDLAGSERIKKTKADGQRLQEGIHINRGLLALGNVISALGDEKRKKEGFVPYRDSKLTRLLQDSLGGNSRTAMIACISPADINMDETINTLKYANRARNIQNKPTINRDPIAAEMQGLRHQVQLLQAELAYSREGGVSLGSQERIKILEAENVQLQLNLNQATHAIQTHEEIAFKILAEGDTLKQKLSAMAAASEPEFVTQSQDLVSQIQSLTANILDSRENLPFVKSETVSESPLPILYQMRSPLPHQYQSCTPDTEESKSMTEESSVPNGLEIVEAEVWEDKAKYMEFQMLQEESQQQLQALDQRIVEKEEKLRDVDKHSSVSYERKFREMEEERTRLLREKEKLVQELEHVAHRSDEKAKAQREKFRTELEALNKQLEQHRRKEADQRNQLKSKQKVEEMAKKLQDEILRIKQAKVQLQRKMKQDADHFQAWKLAREKELLQLRKEGRRTEYEMHKLQVLHDRQTLVLQRKMEEAAQATKKLSAVLDKGRTNRVPLTGNAATVSRQTQRDLSAWLENELALVVGIHEFRRAIQQETERRAALGKEHEALIKREAGSSYIASPGNPLMSPSGLKAKATSLQAAMTACTQNIQTMHHQLAEAEERERSMDAQMRFKSFQGLKETRSLLNLAFTAAVSARCELNEEQQRLKDLMEQKEELQTNLANCENRLLLKDAKPVIEWKTPPAGFAPSPSLRLQSPFWSLDLKLPSREQGRMPSAVIQSPCHQLTLQADSDMDCTDETDFDPDYTPGQEKRFQYRSKSRFSGMKMEPAIMDKPAVETNEEFCTCSGKCSRKCPCKTNGLSCGSHCKCKSQRCVNRLFHDVDPAAVVTAAVMDLEEAVAIRTCNEGSQEGLPTALKGYSREQRNEFVEDTFQIHGFRMAQAMRNALEGEVPSTESLRNPEEGGGAKPPRPLQDVQKNQLPREMKGRKGRNASRRTLSDRFSVPVETSRSTQANQDADPTVSSIPPPLATGSGQAVERSIGFTKKPSLPDQTNSYGTDESQPNLSQSSRRKGNKRELALGSSSSQEMEASGLSARGAKIVQNRRGSTGQPEHDKENI